MKQIAKRLLAIMLVITVFTTGLSINEQRVQAKTKNYVKTLKVTGGKRMVKVGEKTKFKVSVKTRGKVSKKFKVRVNKKGIVKISVKKNIITVSGKKAGTAKVTVETKKKGAKGKRLKKALTIVVTKKKVITTAPKKDSSKAEEVKDNKDYYTYAEWNVLLQKNIGFSSVEGIEEENCHFSNTFGKDHCLATELAYCYKILPEDTILEVNHKVIFNENAKVTREYAAYTMVRALGFQESAVKEVASVDRANLKYEEQDAIAIDIELMSLENNHFYPNRVVTKNEAKLLFALCQNLADDEIDIPEGKTIDEVDYQDDVITADQIGEADYSIEASGKEDYEYVIEIDKTDATSKIKEGTIFILPGRYGDTSLAAYKAIKSLSQDDDSITIAAGIPEFDEVAESAHFAGMGTAKSEAFVPAEGVEVVKPKENINAKKAVKATTKADGKGKNLGNLTVNFDWQLTEHTKLSAIVGVNVRDVICDIELGSGLFSSEKIKKFEVGATEELSVNAQITALSLSWPTDRARWEWEDESCEIQRRKIGTIPIAMGMSGITFDVVLFFEYYLSGSGNINWSIICHQEIKKVNNSWQNNTDDNGGSFDELHFEGAARLGLGIGLSACALKSMKFATIQTSAGVGMAASFYSRLNSAGKWIRCLDETTFLYWNVSIPVDGGFIPKILKRFGFFLSWDVFSEDNSPLRYKFHSENGEIVDKCSFEEETTSEQESEVPTIPDWEEETDEEEETTEKEPVTTEEKTTGKRPQDSTDELAGIFSAVAPISKIVTIPTFEGYEGHGMMGPHIYIYSEKSMTYTEAKDMCVSLECAYINAEKIPSSYWVDCSLVKPEDLENEALMELLLSDSTKNFAWVGTGTVYGTTQEMASWMYIDSRLRFLDALEGIELPSDISDFGTIFYISPIGYPE